LGLSRKSEILKKPIFETLIDLTVLYAILEWALRFRHGPEPSLK
jgi:hypothetical protein